MRIFLVLVLLCITGAYAAPTGSSTCASKCITVYNPKFKYDVGKVYTYGFETTTTLSADGAAKEEPSLKLKTNADIHVLSPCEFALKLSGVKLDGPGKFNQQAFKTALESKPLLFSFTDGRVDHVCPDSKDPVWSVNVKRAVLSAFQNSMDKNLETHIREADVLGLCDTLYVAKPSGKNTEVVKTKDLLTCTNRRGNFTSIQANRYASTSRFQSAPVVKSAYECTQVLTDSQLKSSSCEEDHGFLLYAKANKGAYLKTVTKLTFTKSGNSNLKNPPKNVEHEPLFFDHSEDDSDKPDKAEAEKVLKEICTTSDAGTIPHNAADIFTRFVYLLRRLPDKDVKALQAKAEACKSPKTKDVFLGALSSAGTESSLKALVEAIKKGDQTKARVKLWKTALAFVPRPTQGAVEAVLPLITADKPSRTAVLGITSMAHAYCRQNTECESVKTITKLEDLLAQIMGRKCKASNDEEEDKVVLALKGFGNLGRVGKHENAILDCIKDTKLSVPIRLAAIEAFRRTPPDEHVVDVLLEILGDKEQDTEVRIASYLGLIKRANRKIVHDIKDILDKEEVDQVENFIWSHLKNLKETESPLKQEIKEIVDDLHFPHKFHLNPRLTSRNIEASSFHEGTNIGGTVDANIIYTPDSILPRSAMINVTVDAFGSSVDLIELNVRGENFEQTLEKYFGPSGKFATQTTKELLSQLRNRWRGIAAGIDETSKDDEHSKHRRALPYKPQKLKDLQNKAAIAPATTPEGSYSVKVFGNELRWRNFHDIDDIYDKDDPYNLKDIFNQMAKHKEFDVARNWMFLDSTFSFPTSSGFPLKYDLNGTFSAGLKMNSHFDIRDMFLKPRRVDIKSLIEPSMDIQWGGALILDAHVAKTGLKLVSNAYSSDYLDTTIQYKEGENLEVKFDFPKKEYDLFDYKANLYIVQNDVDVPATRPSPERYNIKACSTGPMARMGLEMCGHVSLPKPLISTSRPLLPLGGDIEYSLKIKKTDENLQGFHFIATRKVEQGPDGLKNAELKLSLNTPGSKVDREITFEYQLNVADKQLKVLLKSPEKKISLNGNYVDGENTKEGKLTLNINDQREYSITGKTAVTKAGNTVTYKPVWEITRPDGPKTTVTGTVVRTIGSKIEFDLKSDPSSERKVALKGNMYRETDFDVKNFKGGIDLAVTLPYIEGKIVGKAETHLQPFGESKMELDLDGEYTLKGSELRKVSLKWQGEHQRDEGIFKIKRLMEWKTSRFPQYNGHVNILLERVQDDIHHFLDLKWGDDFSDPNKKLYIDHKHKTKKTGKGSLDGEGSLKVIYPRRSIDWDIKSEYHVQPKKFNYDLEWKYGGNKKATVKIDLKNETTKLEHLKGEIQILLPTREIVLRDEWQEKSKNKYEGVTYIQWNKGQHITLNSKVNAIGADDPHKVHLEAEVVAVLYSSPKPVRKYNLVLYFDPHHKFITTFKVQTPETVYVVDLQYEIPEPGSANLKFVLKLPWVDGHLNSKRTIEEFEGDLDFKTEKRRVVGSVALKGVGIKKDLAAELKWDAGKDDSKKIALKADVLRARRRAIELTGTLNLPSRTVKGKAGYELPLDLFRGQHNVFFDVEYAPGKKAIMDTKIYIDKTIKGRRLSNGEIYLNTPVTEVLQVAYNTDFHKLPDQHSFKANINVDSSKRGNIVIAIDHLRGHRKFNTGFDITYGGGKTIGAGVGAFYDVGSGDGFDVGGTLKLKTNNVDFLFALREGFQRSPEYTHIVHDNRVRWAPEKEVGAVLEWTRKIVPGKGFEVAGKVAFLTPLEHLRKQKLAADLAFHKELDGGHLSSNFLAVWGTGKTVETLVRYNRQGRSIDTHIVWNATTIAPSAFLEIVYEHSPNSLDSQLYTSHGKITDIKEEVTFVNKGIWTPEKKTMDMTITRSTALHPANIKGELVISGEQRTLNLIITTTPDKNQAVKVNGKWTKDAGGNVAGQIVVDASAVAEIQPVTMDISAKLQGAKRSYSTLFDLGQDRKFKIAVDVEDKGDKSGKTGKGVININGEDFMTYDFDLVDKPTNKHKFGRILSYKANLHNENLAFATEGSIYTDKGLNPSFKICTKDKVKCAGVEALIDLHKWDNKLGPIDDVVYMKFVVQRAPGDSRTLGFAWQHKKQKDLYERSFKFIINKEENKYLGYSFKGVRTADSKTRTYQILLPTRVLQAQSETKYSNQGFVYKLHILSDASQAKQELLITVDVKNSTSGDLFTRVSTITIKHPKLAKTITLKNELKRNAKDEKLSIHSELDASSDPKKKFIMDLVIDNNTPEQSSWGHNLTLNLEVQQVNNAIKFQYHAKLVNGETARGVKSKFTWYGKSGEKTYLFGNRIDKVDNTIEGIAKTPYRELTWTGVYRKLDDNGEPALNANLDISYNKKLVRRLDFGYSRGPEYNIKYFVDPSDTSRLFRLHGGVLHHDVYRWTASRVKGGQALEDFDIYLKLNNSHLLYNKYTWRPDLLADIKQGIKARLEKVGKESSEAAQNFAQNVKEELSDKIKIIRETLKPTVSPFIQDVRAKISTTISDLKTETTTTVKFDRLKDVLHSIFGNIADTEGLNRLLDHIAQRITDILKALVEKVSAFYQRFLTRLDTLDDVIADALADLPDRINKLRERVAQNLPLVADKIEDFINNLKDRINDLLDKQHITKALAAFREAWDSNTGHFKEVWDKYVGGFSAPKLGEFYERIKTRLWEYAESDGAFSPVVKGILTTIKSIKEAAKELGEKICNTVKAVWEAIFVEYVSLYNKMLENEDAKALIQELKTFREQVKAQLEASKSAQADNVKEKLRDYVDAALEKIRNKIQKFADSIVVDLKGGRIEFYLPLIVPVESMYQLRKRLDIGDALESRRSPIFDRYSRIRPIFTRGTKDYWPVFSSQAMLIGEQHYVTFDQRFYDFAGKCQYLLTNDFADQNFSVIVNYDGESDVPRKKSFLVISDLHHIEIGRDYKVVLDEQEIELPTQIEQTFVRRDWNVIRIDNNKGFTFSYDVPHDIAYVNISGWYFGKVSGLFGNNNDEPSDDIRNPEGQTLSSITQFADSWDVSKDCTTKENDASQDEAASGSEGYDACYRIFKSSYSTFGECTPYVATDNFLKVCLQEVAIHKEQHYGNGVCRAAAAYLHACDHYNVHLSMPSKCRTS